MSPLELFDEIISFEVSCVVFGSEIRWTGQHLVGLISQFHNQKWKILVGHWTIQLGIQWLVFILTQLHFVQWSSLPILFAKFECPVGCQNVSLLATVNDCEIGLIQCPGQVCLMGVYLT